MNKDKQRNAMKRHQAEKDQAAAMREKVAKSRTSAAAVQCQDAPFPDQVPIDAAAPGKLSTAVLEYADPLIESAQGDDEIHKAISIAVLSWNLSLLPKAEARAELQQLVASAVDSADGGLDRDLLAIFEMMYSRRQSLFADDHRPVLNYEITVTDNSYHLEVTSVVPAV